MNKSPVRFYFSAPHARAECLAPMRRAKLDAPRAGDAEQKKSVTKLNELAEYGVQYRESITKKIKAKMPARFLFNAPYARAERLAPMRSSKLDPP